MPLVETQPNAAQSDDLRMRRSLLTRLGQTVLPETLGLVILCFADLAWTIIAVHLGIAKETNPLLAGALSRSTVLFAILKLVSFLFPVTVLEMMRPKWPAIVTRGMRTALLSYVALYVIGSLHVHGFF